MNQHTKPCGSCAFRRRVEPGATGGSPPEVFIGQVTAGFFLPCHESYKKGLHAKQHHHGNSAQCAGAATLRANVGIPAPVESILTVAEDRETVFADFAEFLAHHRRISLSRAKAALAMTTPYDLAKRELSDPACKVQLIPRK